MPQVEQGRSTTSSMTLPMTRMQNTAAGHTHPYVLQYSSAPRKHRLSPPRTNKSNDPSSAGPGPIRRALSARSQPQGPVAASLRDAPSHLGFHQSTPYSLPKPQTQVTYTNPRAPTNHLAPSSLHAVDQAFTAYTDRLQSSLNEFHAVCTTLVVHEQEERKRVHNLCLKIMQERDFARRKVDALLTETAGADANKGGKKRLREEEIMCILPPVPSSSSSSSAKVLGFLETSLSPVVSPDVSPFNLPHSLPTRSSSDHSTTPTLVSVVPPHLSSPLSNASDTLSPLNLPLGAGPKTPMIKRRKSCDAPRPEPSGTELPPALSRKARKDRTAPPEAPPMNFEHVDLMYIPSKTREGALVCRACLLESSKSRLLSPSPLCLQATSCLPSPTSPPTDAPQSKLLPSSTRPGNPVASPKVRGAFEPTTFPPGTSWHDLKDHCVRVHPKECEDVNRLHPSQVWELRRRLGIR